MASPCEYSLCRHGMQVPSLTLVVFAWLMSCSLTLKLDGSPGSFVKYPPWEPCLNGSLSFEFCTTETNALLLYFEKGKHFFFEMKLHNSRLRLHLNVGGGVMIMHAGHSLNSNEWHSVEVRQDGEVTSILVDGVERSERSANSPTMTQNSNSSFLFIGGLPDIYKTSKWNSLAVQSVVYEPKFRGSFRNMFYTSCGAEPYRPEPIESKGILTLNVDLCERGNPCLNGGRCLTTDDGIFCDCINTEYNGERCDIQKIPSDATFLGNQYLSYNMSQKRDFTISNHDQISLDFRTKQPSSLLFYTGNDKDHMTVGLIDGAIFLAVNLGSGLYKEEIRPNGERFDDNRWHQLQIRRDAKKLTRDQGVCYVSIQVDGVYAKSGSTSGRFVRLSSAAMYVAGSPHTESLAGSRVKNNFKGCMRKVRYTADSVRIDLMEMARRQHALLTIVGDVIFDKCQELVDSQPVTFTNGHSYLTVPMWNRPSLKGSMAFQFRTTEPGGLLMYSNGHRDSNDFFAIELLDGHLYLVLDMGSGVQKVQASKRPVTDGRPHDVYFEYSGSKGYIAVDGQKAAFSSPRIGDRFDLHGQLYLGGVGSNFNVSTLPPALWSAMLGLSYVGCLQDLLVSGKQVDLVTAARLQNQSGVQGYCKRGKSHCGSHPCNHQGICVEGWNRFTCDCRATGYTGSLCQRAAATLRFDGDQTVDVRLVKEMVTQAEDVSLRFRTMHPDGFIFMTKGVHGDSMELYLSQGVLSLAVSVDTRAKILSIGHKLNDDRWHTVFITRRSDTIHLAIDQGRPVTDQLQGVITSLRTRYISVGQMLPNTNNEGDVTSSASNLMMRDQPAQAQRTGFIGSMQAFVFNGMPIFQLDQSESVHNITMTARYSSDEYVVREPVTFKSVDAFAVLNTLQAHDHFSISLQLKTTEENGLLLYNGGKERDFIGLELFQGFLYYIYNMGEGEQSVKANLNHPINDNKWHEIRLLRTETFKQLIRVDANTPTIDDLSGARNTMFDLDGPLYVGGVRRTMYSSLPKVFKSRHGFVGCLGSLDLNGYMPTLLSDANPIHEAVGDGCKGPLTKCVNDSCANLGRCVQQWTSYRCDCDMTSYTGPMCKDNGVTYKFGPGSGLMTFAFPESERLSTTSESIAFGFRTTQDNAIILRMSSAAYEDFIQIELTKGNVYVTYDLGTFTHPIGDFYQRVNDGLYHVVRYTRSGPNATLQVDNSIPLTKNPTGHQAHTFNKPAYIVIGGRRMTNGSHALSLDGTISGMVINGIRVFEKAKDGIGPIHTEGRVHLVSEHAGIKGSVYEMQSTQGRKSWIKPSHRWDRVEKNNGDMPVDLLTRNQTETEDAKEVTEGFNETTQEYNPIETPKIRRRRQVRRAVDLSERPWTSDDYMESSADYELIDEKSLPDLRDKTMTHFGDQEDTIDKPEEDDNEKSISVPRKSDDHAKHENIHHMCHYSNRAQVHAMPKAAAISGSSRSTVSPFNEVYRTMTSRRKKFEQMSLDEANDETDDIIRQEEVVLEKQGNQESWEGSGWTGDDGKVENSNYNVETKDKFENEHKTVGKSNTSDWHDLRKFSLYRKETTTLLLPVRGSPTALQTTSSRPRLMWTLAWTQTTTRETTTDDIIVSGPGSGCQSEDDEECLVVGSGNDMEIISPVVFIKGSTTTPSTTTTSSSDREPNACKGPDCETSSKLEQQQYESPLPTSFPKEVDGGGNGKGQDGNLLKTTASPENVKDKDKDKDKGINLALILGITGSVLVAVIVLCVALYKLRSRDEGTYKVDETQNFSALQSKKSQGNGTLMTGTESGCSGKRSKKKDVKEWYV